MSNEDDPYGDDPVLAALPRQVRQQIAEQFAQGKRFAAMNTLRKAIGGGLGNPELARAGQALGEYWQSGKSAQTDKSAAPLKITVASGAVDKTGTTLTLYDDGTFTTRGLLRTSEPDRLVAFSSDIDSMRRKSATGRGAAALMTSGVSLLASNNRGVIYVTVAGEGSGTKTYTTRNPDDKLLTTVRTLQSAADRLLVAHDVAVGAGPLSSQTGGDVAGQLKTLAELHASGALSDDEFASAKARLLS